MFCCIEHVLLCRTCFVVPFFLYSKFYYKTSSPIFELFFTSFEIKCLLKLLFEFLLFFYLSLKLLFHLSKWYSVYILLNLFLNTNFLIYLINSRSRFLIMILILFFIRHGIFPQLHLSTISIYIFILIN